MAWKQTMILLMLFITYCDARLQDSYSKLQYGYRLDRKMISSFIDFSILDCAEECLRTKRCKSMSYYKGANFCEINYENKSSANDRFLESPGWTYSEKENWDIDIVSSCSASNCSINEKCKPLPMGKFECVLSDCGIPSQWGVNLSSVGRWEGIGIERFMKLDCYQNCSQSGSRLFVCAPNGQWKTNLKCATDHCVSSPCQNGGYCTSNATAFSCKCADGFIGNTCEDIDHCASSPCKNNGMCTSGPTTFSCQCADGFIGNTCEDIDHCASSPCKNYGICTSGPTTFSCQCADGLIGDTCRRCPSSWIEYQGHCYYLDEKIVNWTDAKLECRKRGSHLVEIEDQEKSEWLASTFLVKSTCPTDLYKCTAWTGGNDVDIEGQYRWSYSNVIFTFHSWKRGEPSVGYPKQAEERDCIDLLRNGKWNDRRCSYLNLFICEMFYGQYN